MAKEVDPVDLVFRALASKQRRAILRLLATADQEDEQQEVCACVFSNRLGLGAPTVSHHMKILQDAGLVVGEKRGLWVYYRLRGGSLQGVVSELYNLGVVQT
ncbi:MAG: ArsR/SmtB family transcription factor [Candidatus Aquicultorales bacterium]